MASPHDREINKSLQRAHDAIDKIVGTGVPVKSFENAVLNILVSAVELLAIIAKG